MPITGLLTLWSGSSSVGYSLANMLLPTDTAMLRFAKLYCFV